MVKLSVALFFARSLPALYTYTQLCGLFRYEVIAHIVDVLQLLLHVCCSLMRSAVRLDKGSTSTDHNRTDIASLLTPTALRYLPRYGR